MFLERIISYPSFIRSYVPTVPMIDRTGVSLSSREKVAFDLFLNILEKKQEKNEKNELIDSKILLFRMYKIHYRTVL